MRRSTRARACGLGISALLLGGLLTASTPAAASVPADADWILTARLPDGALKQYPDPDWAEGRINPYLANLAALGLAHAYGSTGDIRYLDAATSWLGWYQSHMDAQGFVHDHLVAPAPELTETPQGYDSTDGYAGTFALAVREVYLVTGDPARVAPFQSGIRKAFAAITATQDSDGLTWATPGWHVKYLMDQSESYAGLRSISQLAALTGNSDLAGPAAAKALAVKNGVATMWLASAGLYSNAKFEDGSLDPSSWGHFYPDAVAQLWAIALGSWAVPGDPLIDPVRAAVLVDTFASTWPQWTQPDAVVAYSNGGSGPVNYWPLLGAAFAWVGRGTEGLAGTNAIAAYGLAQGRPWPFSVATAGQVIPLQDTRSRALRPQARLSATPTSGPAPLTVTFDGSQTSDPQGTVASWRLSFGDGSPDTTGLLTPSLTSHTYANFGSYTAALTVTNTQAVTGTALVSVRALSRPTAVLSASPSKGVSPLAVTFDTRQSVDPDGSIVSVRLSFGDGSPDATAAAPTTFAHTYVQSGNRTATLVVTDNDGLTRSVATAVSAKARR